MAIFKDCDLSAKEIVKSISDLFNEGRYIEMFQKAGFKNSNSKNKKEQLVPFYEILSASSIPKMVEKNTIEDFLSALVHFLDNGGFTNGEKTSFFNNCENGCIKAALNVNKFDIAQKINLYRENKDIFPFHEYIADKAKKENFEVIEQLLSLSSGVTRNHCEILRIIYCHGVRNYDFLKNLIKKYNWDINGVGTTLGFQGSVSFVHMVASYDGTMGSKCFYKLIEEFSHEINFDMDSFGPDFTEKFNLIGTIFCCKLNSIEKLDRLCAVLEHCDVLVKYIGQISYWLMKKEYYCNYYEHPIYEVLFAHNNFNSDFFDREAILNKIVLSDNAKEFIDARNTFKVNPTSVMLSNFFNLAKPAIPMNKHPFITWIENQNEGFSKETLKSLVNHYGNDLLELDLSKVVINNHVVKALEGFGFEYSKPSKWKVMLNRYGEAKKVHLIRINQPSANEDIIERNNVVVKPLINNFSIALIDQVKDIDIKKLIESVHFNYQQYHDLDRNRMMDDNVHYMTELLPKFLKTTIDNYLHFSMLDSDYAKEEAIVQLKLLNRKAFSILKEELENEQKDMEYRNAVHKKVMENY
jgi:hypothetical protein